MTGKVFQPDEPNLSLLIIPLAVGIILIAMAWPLLLLLIAALVAWKVYDNIHWQRKCDSLNPLFNQLIKDNKGCLTVLDFSNKTSLNEKLAKNFLERKAQEYGAVRKQIGKKAIIYYFITASALGSIFDESEATDDQDPSPNIKELNSTSNVLAELAQLKKTHSQTPILEPTKPILDEVTTLSDSKEPQGEITPTSPKEPQGEITPTSPKEPQGEITPTSPKEPQREITPTSPKEPQREITPTFLEESQREITPTSPEVEVKEDSLQLIQSELAKRLDINSSTIGKRKLESDFSEWSQSKDPEGIAWVYVQETKVFIPKTP